MCCPTNSNQFSDIIKVLIPVATFIAGLFLTPYVESIKDNLRLIKIEKLFYQLIEMLFEQMRKQNIKIKECIDKIVSYDINDLTINRVSGRSLEKFDKISEFDMFKLLVLRKKGNLNSNVKSFKDLLKCIDYFGVAYTNLFEVNKEAIIKINSNLDDWNNANKKFTSYYNQAIIEQNINGNKSDNFLDKVVVIHTTYNNKYADKTLNLEKAMSEYVQPIIDECINFSSDYRASLFLTELQNAKHAFLDIDKVRTDLKFFLETTYSELKKTIGQLEELVTNFKKTKNKKIMNVA